MNQQRPPGPPPYGGQQPPPPPRGSAPQGGYGQDQQPAHWGGYAGPAQSQPQSQPQPQYPYQYQYQYQYQYPPQYPAQPRQQRRAPAWVWAVIGVLAVGIVVTFVAAVVLLLRPPENPAVSGATGGQTATPLAQSTRLIGQRTAVPAETAVAEATRVAATEVPLPTAEGSAGSEPTPSLPSGPTLTEEGARADVDRFYSHLVESDCVNAFALVAPDNSMMVTSADELCTWWNDRLDTWGVAPLSGTATNATVRENLAAVDVEVLDMLSGDILNHVVYLVPVPSAGRWLIDGVDFEP